MKNIKFLILIISALAITSACEKSLDLKPYQYLDESIALSNDANVKSVLVGAYSSFRGDYVYGGIILRNAELLVANDEISWQGTYSSPREIYNHSIISANSDVTNQSLQSYDCINICNNVLSALAVVNEEDKAQVEGEALFLRSLMYFDLVRFFANTYEAGAANTQYGVPLILTPTHVISGANQVGRNSVQEVYAKVIADLQRAASILPEENGYYATSGAANALLARVYLQQGDFAKARDAADAVIGSGLYSLTSSYSQAFNNEEYTSEDIFATKYNAANGVNPMTEFWSTTEYGGRDGDIEILDGHLELYDPADQRLELFWVGNNAMRSGKWNTQYGLVNLFRLAEMYLIRAECNNRLGTSVGDSPANDFNMVHERAGLDPIAEGDLTLDDILYERRLEFAHEGFRYHDVKRLKLTVGAFAYDDPSMIFPIPSREMEANQALIGQQNEGY